MCVCVCACVCACVCVFKYLYICFYVQCQLSVNVIDVYTVHFIEISFKDIRIINICNSCDCLISCFSLKALLVRQLLL